MEALKLQWKVLIGLGVVFLLALGYQNSKSASASFELKMVHLEPGKFTLYVPINGYFKVEYIKKFVEIKKPFSIGAYEITNDQWNTCYKDKGCSKSAEIRENEKGNHPVTRVNWHDAMEFTKWLSKKYQKKYRLPTEEEWSYAAYLGKDHKDEEVEYDYSSPDSDQFISKITKPQGHYGKNAWGLYDTIGNTWEWTLTCWYSSEENILKERPPEEITSTDACTTRIAQGENRSHIPDFIYDTYNGGCATLRPAANLGFRVVLED